MAVTQTLQGRRHHHAAPFTSFPVHVNHRVVTTAETETVPDGANAVIITSDADIWLSDGTAVVPAGDVIDGTGSFPLAAGVARGFYVSPGQTLSVISASGTANVGFEYFAEPQ
jgi:hypothetical protein